MTSIKITQVKKKDGRLQGFDLRKIERSLRLTQVKEGQGLFDRRQMAQIIHQALESFQGQVSSQDLGQVLVAQLQKHGESGLAQSFQAQAKKKDQTFASASNLSSSLSQLMEEDRSVVNENANKDARVFNTQRDLTAGAVAKAQGLRMLPRHVARAHVKGQIHVHDLDYQPYSPMTNCSLIHFEEMFQTGFKIGNAEVESPKSIQTAAAQMAQIIANVASSQYGGTTADRVDELLAPYAEINYQKNIDLAQGWLPEPDQQEAFAKERTQKDIQDAMQSLEYEINTLFSSQGQTPFTTLGFGLGQSWIEREIQKAILDVRIKGLGTDRRTAIFPKLVFTLKEGVNLRPSDPNYDIKQLALTCATQRMYPDVVMYDKIVDLTGSFKAPMGCRSFLQGYENPETGLDETSGRMNLGVVTLNLPRIAIEARGSLDDFWTLFHDRLDLLADALLYRVDRILDVDPDNAPILYQSGAFGYRLQSGESVDALFTHRRATVSMGYIGLYEVATLFYGPDWEDQSEAKELTLDVLRAMKKKAEDLSNQYNYHFSVYSTPSESLTDRFCRIDKEDFGSISDVTDKDYYTNSFHYDVRKQPTPFEKIDFEKDYPFYASGGFIHYCEYPNMKQNPRALEAVWDYAYDRIGYLGTNTPIDRCYLCGFEGDFEPTHRGFQCPECGNRDPESCDVVKRTCGYLGNPQARPMVAGRHKEIASRQKHLGQVSINPHFYADGIQAEEEDHES